MIRLTRPEIEVLAEMNRGMYLGKHGTTEFMSKHMDDKKTAVKAGTVERLLDYGLIRKSEKPKLRKFDIYLLTDSGREYRKIE